MERQKLGFLGAGNMATALMRGVLRRGNFDRNDLCASDISRERCAIISDDLGVGTSDDNASVCAFADVVVLAVKPQVVDRILADIAPVFTPKKLCISVCAGVPTARLEQALGQNARVVRAMPNTPALIGEGATAIAPGAHASPDDTRVAESLFECVGECVTLEEHLMDAVTGLSGSGPAYVLMAIEAMTDGGVNVGLPRSIAHRLALQTFLGTARLVSETGEHPAVLRDRVASPGGTTIRGVHALEAAGFRRALMDAVGAATQRSRELGQAGSS